MLDNDNLTYRQPKRVAGFGMSKAPERSLLTPDRSQKLDLLIHLLTNLQQSLVVCGPEGIGKTNLLNTLINSHKDIWPICLLQGSSTLSFESIMMQLSQFLNLSSASVHFDMSSLRAFCEKQKVVLLIDDAGNLVPGLIGELIDFADSLPGLRLVFSMDYEEFQAKSSTDKTLDDCHFIELPPLNQRQTLEYLQNLSAQPDTPLSFNAVTDALAEALYRQTQGIPGKLLAELPKLENYQGRQQRRRGLWLGVSLIVVAMGFAMKSLLPPTVFEDWLGEKPTEPVQAISESAPAAIAPLEAIVESTPLDTPSISAPAEPLPPEPLPSLSASVSPDGLAEPLPQGIPTPAPKPAQATVTPPQIIAPSTIEPESTAQLTPPAAEETAVVEPKPAEPETPVEKQLEPKPVQKPVIAKSETNGGDLDWITSQPATHYTVQIMVLSSRDSVNRFLRKHAEYRESLKYYSIGKEGQERYVLIYGSFPSSIDALNSKSTMPDEFNQGLVKRFTVIQKEIRRKK